MIAERIDENQENITLIWFDPNISSDEEFDTKIKRLRDINDYVLFYTELDQCLQRIQSIQDEKIFLITSDVHASQLLPLIRNLPQIDSIFYFCMKKDEDTHRNNDYSKIIGIYEDFDSLCQAIEEHMKLVEKQLETFCIFDQLQKSTRDLSKQSAEFLWFQLLKNVLRHFPRNQNDKKRVIDASRLYYQGNDKVLKQIDDFERNYRPDVALQWYTNKSFVYKLINKALRNKNIKQLYNFLFFIDDLPNNLIHEHQKMVQLVENIVTVYRGIKLSSEELNQLKDKQGKLISTNGYLSASRIRENALALATKSTVSLNTLGVLFEIKCDVQQLGNKVVFADLAESSEHPNNDKEVLFDLGTAFRLESVEEDDQVWVIKMSASSDGQTVAHDYIEIARRETDGETEAVTFGRLMCQMGHYDESRRYFERLLMHSNKDDVGSIEYNLALAAHHKGDLKRARELYDHVYDRMMHTNPPKTKDSAYVLNGIGHVLELQGKYDESRQFYQRALTIREKYCPADHPDIAISLKSIGSLLYQRQKYNESLDFVQRALKIQEKYYADNRRDFVDSLNLMGKNLLKQGKYSEALKIFQRALEIQEEYYSTNHPDKIESLNNIAASYEKLKVPRVALAHCKRALAIQEKSLPVGHQNRVKTEGNIHRLSSYK